MCVYDNCDKYRNNEPCDDNIVFCEKSLAEHDAKIKTRAIKLLKPWLEYAVDGMCDEIKEMTFDGETDWCNENCNNFCTKCVMKWLELKEQK